MVNQQKIINYSVSFWIKSGMTENPTVRQAARRFGVSQKMIIEEVECSEDMCLEYYNAVHKPGDKFIYVINDDRADAHWNKYIKSIFSGETS